MTLLGSSGCGKTTTLNMVAGLEDATSGDILMNGRRVNDLSPVERDVAMVFQNYALYPHMTVAQNIGFTLKMRGHAAATRSQRARRAGRRSRSSSRTCSSACPSQLSGGQQQRVAIGRALVREPQVFLFDEPFSNLDAALRVKMRAEVKELHQRLGVTSIFVTHDQEEAMSISDRIAVMNQGASSSSARRRRSMRSRHALCRQLHRQPADRTRAGGMIGDRRRTRLPDRSDAASACPRATGRFASGQDVDVGIRPEHVRLGDNGIPATVRLVQPVGPATHVTLDWDGGSAGRQHAGLRAPASSAAPSRVELDPRHICSSSTARPASGSNQTTICKKRQDHEPDMLNPNSVASRDVAFHLHSQTNPKHFEEQGPLVVTRGEGIRVFDERRQALHRCDGGPVVRLARLQQRAPRGGGHASNMPSSASITRSSTGRMSRRRDLAEKLVELTGMTGGKAYFATSGSEANETMVKLAWVYHTVRGKPTKRKVIARDRAFHGSTIAAASMCGLEFMHREFGLPLPGFLHTLCPSPYRGMLRGRGRGRLRGAAGG